MESSFHRLSILAIVVVMGITSACNHAPMPEAPPPVQKDTLLTSVQEDRGATDIDALAKILMQSLVSGSFDYLERHALPPETYWETLPSDVMQGAQQNLEQLRRQFAEARKAGEIAGIQWPKVRLLTTSLNRQKMLPGGRALMDVLVNCEGKEFQFKAECARVGLVWFVVGGIAFDDEMQGT